ncbi:unnamed protein product [Closterium sp. Yama58-4]|nr:unnamed protein product [Closterium sp. Yama58-4]
MSRYLGQALSTRPDILPPEYCAELALLQDRMAPFPCHVALATVQRELGVPPGDLFAEFSPAPVAAASLGQVYKARLRSGEWVAVKIQRPAVQQQIALDSLVVRRVAALLQPLVHGRSDLVAIADQLVCRMFDEVDYEQEGRNAERFQALYGDHGAADPEKSKHSRGTRRGLVKVPRIFWEYSSRRVLTMEWIDGIKLTDRAGLLQAGLDTQFVVDLGVLCSLRQLLEEGFFHADPHPGNLVVTRGGQLAYFDFGMMGELPPQQRISIIRAVVHYVNRDAQGLAHDFRALHFIPPQADVAPVAAALAEVFREGEEAKRGGSTSSSSISGMDFQMNTPPSTSSLPPRNYRILSVPRITCHHALSSLPFPATPGGHPASLLSDVPLPLQPAATPLPRCARPWLTRRHSHNARPQLQGSACRSVSMACRSVSMACRSVSMACRSVSMACRSVSMACRSVSMACRSVSMACRSVSMACRSVSMACRAAYIDSKLLWPHSAALTCDAVPPVVATAYPFIIARLLSDPSPDMRAILRQMLLWPSGAIRWQRLQRLASVLSKPSPQHSTGLDHNSPREAQEGRTGARVSAEEKQQATISGGEERQGGQRDELREGVDEAAVVAAAGDFLAYVMSAEGSRTRGWLVLDAVAAGQRWVDQTVASTGKGSEEAFQAPQRLAAGLRWADEKVGSAVRRFWVQWEEEVGRREGRRATGRKGEVRQEGRGEREGAGEVGQEGRGESGGEGGSRSGSVSGSPGHRGVGTVMAQGRETGQAAADQDSRSSTGKEQAPPVDPLGTLAAAMQRAPELWVPLLVETAGRAEAREMAGRVVRGVAAHAADSAVESALLAVSRWLHSK